MDYGPGSYRKDVLHRKHVYNEMQKIRQNNFETAFSDARTFLFDRSYTDAREICVQWVGRGSHRTCGHRSYTPH